MTRGWVYFSHKPECFVTTQIPKIGHNHDYDMPFLTLNPECEIPHLKGEYGALSENRFVCYSHCYITWLNDGNCGLTMPIVKGGGARDQLPDVTMISVFKSAESKCLPQWNMCTMNLRKLCWFFYIDGPSHGNAAGDCYGGHGVTRPPSIHIRSLDARYM